MDFDINKHRFLSTYNKHYIEKPVNITPTMKINQEFADPISASYKEFLVLDESDVKRPNEDGEEYLKRLKKKDEKIGRVHFKEPINKDLILRKKISEGMVTEYQMNYCDIEKDVQYYIENRGKAHMLSDDAVIPLTVHTQYFRNPHEFLKRYCERPAKIVPPYSLKAMEKITVNNVSEYTDHIGKLGERIVKECFVRRNLKNPKKIE